MEKCPKCKNPEIINIEYEHDHPEHYDGVSEFKCSDPLCGYREGRWSGKELKEGECEKKFGIERKKICYVCEKECDGNIGEDYYDVGLNKEGKYLYRHIKCKPDLSGIKLKPIKRK